MPYIDAVILARYVKDFEDANVPDLVDEIYVWAIANGEQLPDGPYGRYEDLTGQANVHQRVLDNLSIFIAKLEVTVNTAQHFAADPRLFVLGYNRYDDDGELMASNWDETLPAEDRQKAANYVTANSNITAQQLAVAFNATDTRREIAQKLKAFFRST